MSGKTATKEGQDFKVPPKYKFQEGEKVLCFHGPLIYEAKCLQYRFDDEENTCQYQIHYSGWNKNWDEWVPESRVLKFNETNLQKQKELHKAQKAEPKSKRAKKRSILGKEPDSNRETGNESRSSTPISHEKLGGKSGSAAPSSMSESASDVPKRKRNKTDPSVESEEKFLTKVEVKIKLPDDLKPVLVDDWDMINVQQKVYKLPAKTTIEAVLADYLKQKNSGKSNGSKKDKEQPRKEVVKGIKEYFNVMLSTQLLYKPERQQYSDFMKKNPNLKPTQIFGPVYLLRLFVKLGGALAYTMLDEKSVQLLLSLFQDFLRFVVKNSSSLFSTSDYEPAPSPPTPSINWL